MMEIYISFRLEELGMGQLERTKELSHNFSSFLRGPSEFVFVRLMTSEVSD